MRYLPLATLIAWISFVACGIARIETNIEDFVPWLPDAASARTDYLEFIRRFGTDDTLIVSWDGCRPDDKRIERLTEAARSRLSDVVSHVLTPNEEIERLTSKPHRIPRDQVVDRLTGFLIGPDGQTAAIVMRLTDDGMRDRRRTVLRVMQLAEETCGLKRDELHLGGHPYLGYYSSQVTLDSMIWLCLPVALLSTVLAWICLRQFRLMLVTLASAGVAAVTSVALVSWLGFRLNGLLTALPAVVYIITVSGTIHVVNYSLDLHAKRTEKVSEIAQAAALRRKAWKPCLLSAISTALGCLSLMASDFPAIREFGLLTALGITISFVVQIGLLPRLLVGVHAKRAKSVRDKRIRKQLMRLFSYVVRLHRLVIACVVLAAAVLTVPLFRLQGQFTLEQMFSPDSRFMQDIHWLEDHIGPVDATELVIGFDLKATPRFATRISRVRSVEAAVANIEGIDATYSALTIQPRPDGRLSSAVWHYRMRESRNALLESPFLAQEDDHEYWRITLRNSFFDVERDLLRERVIAQVRCGAAGWDDQPIIRFTGASQVFHETQRTVLRDFVESLVLAYGLILIMMIIGLRSLTGGLLSMVPNVVPCISVFGVLGWMDGTIDIGTTVAACIALGIAVDDTAHLLLTFQDEHRRLGSRLIALRVAYSHCAVAMCQTSLICGVAMMPYRTASLVYLSRFGILLPVLMAAALVGALFLLPALIASPAGRCFELKAKPNET